MHDLVQRCVRTICLSTGCLCLGCLGLRAAPGNAQAKTVAHIAGEKGGVDVAAGEAKAGKAEPPAKTIYDFSLPAVTGQTLPFSTFKGQTVLLVNLARQSSYNDQLAALAKLQTEFAAKKFTVIGIPSNDFGAAEPGDAAVIARFYADQKLGFPVMARSSLRGVEELPLFSFLAAGKDVPAGGEVHWNYTKFLIDAKGKVVARFDPDVSPDSPELRAALQQVLDGTFTQPKKGPESPKGGDEDGDDDSQ